VFRFTAEAAGKVDLELIYKRPFEKDKPPARTYKLAVEIE
jgi:predicted secreted protein